MKKDYRKIVGIILLLLSIATGIYCVNILIYANTCQTYLCQISLALFYFIFPVFICLFLMAIFFLKSTTIKTLNGAQVIYTLSIIFSGTFGTHDFISGKVKKGFGHLAVFIMSLIFYFLLGRTLDYSSVILLLLLPSFIWAMIELKNIDECSAYILANSKKRQQ